MVWRHTGCGDSPCRHCAVACSAVSPSENTDGTFAITAVQHVPEKKAIVDNGARFEPQSGSLNSVIPPAVQHLTVEVSAADGQYLAQAKWDTPRVVKGVRFSLRLTSGKERMPDW